MKLKMLGMSFYGTYRWSKDIFRILSCISDTMERPPLISQHSQNKAHPNALKPYVDKAKMCLRGGRFFKKFYENFRELKKYTTFQTHFGFTNIGSKVHRFSSTVIYFWQFSIGTSCMLHFWPNIRWAKMPLKNNQHFQNCRQTAERCGIQIFENWKTLPSINRPMHNFYTAL